MKTIKKCLALLTALMLVMSTMAFSVSASGGGKNQLQFKDGKFKILVLSDIQDTNTPYQATTDLMKAAIEETKPDFIALTGDNIAGWWKGVDKAQTKEAVDLVAGTIDSYGIPFALVYGNHDHEGLCDENNKMTEEDAKELILSWFQAYDTCLAVEGEEMTGVGNYNLLIKDSRGEKDIFNLWFMDSNPYTPEEEGGGYGYVHEDQTEWYKRISTELKEKNGSEPLPSILFQHIAVPEVYEMFTKVSALKSGSVRGHGSFSDSHYVVNPDYIYQGSLNEGPCPPDTNHGQFQSWVEQGDILGAVFGHDHTNDFAGIYKGIKLIAAPAVTFYSYGNHRGVRTITLDESNLTDFESEIILFEDLVDYKIKNPYIRNHGYIEWKNNGIPLVIGIPTGVAALAAAVTGIVVAVKKKRRNK